MRLLLLLAILLLSALPAAALDWGRYRNTDFGYAIDIPPRFTGNPETAEGRSFQRLERAQGLVVHGGTAPAGFEAMAEAEIARLEAEGWNPGFRVVTPGWAELTAYRGQRALHLRLIALCDPGRYAAYALDYSVADFTETEAVIERLTRTLRPIGPC